MQLRDAAVVVLFIVSAVPSHGQAWVTTPDAPPAKYRGGAALVFPAGQTEAATLEGTTWRLTNLPRHQVAELTALPRQVTLRLADGRASGFAGCNLLSGDYTTKGTSLTLSFASTLMACPEPGLSIERAFLDALKGPLSYAIKADKLTLTAASGAVLEFEREPTMTLEGHAWNVTDYNNGRQAVVSLLPDTRITLSFAQGAVTGSAGCNTFRATSSVQGNGIKIGAPATTRKACPEPVMAQERAFLAALQAATHWTIDGGMLDMHRADGERALSAKPGESK